MKSKLLNMTLRICLAFIGTWLVAMGVLFFIESKMGADPISTFLLGIVNIVPIKIGIASQIFNIGILIIMLIADRHILGIGSLINAFFVGFFVNIFETFADYISMSAPAFLLMILAPVLVGVGTGLYLLAKLGSGALESRMIYISKKSKKLSIRTTRMILDGTLVLTGILCGGAWGIGSVAGILLIGPIIAGTLKVAGKFKFHN